MVVSAEGGSGPAPHHFQALDSWRGIAALIVAAPLAAEQLADLSAEALTNAAAVLGQ